MKEQTCLDLRSFLFSLHLAPSSSSDALPASSSSSLLRLLLLLLLLLLLFLGTTVLPPDVCICTGRVGRVIRHVFVWAIDPINVAAATLPCRVHNSPGMAPSTRFFEAGTDIRRCNECARFITTRLIPIDVDLALLNLSSRPIYCD